jgi:hypothetical protein
LLRKPYCVRSLSISAAGMELLSICGILFLGVWSIKLSATAATNATATETAAAAAAAAALLLMLLLPLLQDRC